ERTLLDHDRIRPEDVVGRGLRVWHDLDGRQVATAEVERLVRDCAQHQHLAIGKSQAREQGCESSGLGVPERELFDDVQRTLSRTRVEGRTPSELLYFPWNFRPVVARDRPEHSAASTPVGSTGRALPRTSGSLLFPRLLIAAGYEASGLGL